MTDSNSFDKQSGQEPPFFIPSSDERTMSILAHVLTIFFGFIPPLIIWLIKKDESKYVAEHAKESLNFQITIFLAYMVAGVLVCLFIGFLLLFVVWAISIVFAILATIEANNNKIYKYPFCLRLIK
jgi:uncharacterized protein